MSKSSSAGFVLLEAGRSAFLVDPAEIQAVAALENIAAMGSRVEVTFNGASIPIYMVDPRLVSAAEGSLPRLMAVSAGKDPFALACSRVGMVRTSDVRLWPVPESMASLANQGVLIAEYRTMYAVHCALDSIAGMAKLGGATGE